MALLNSPLRLHEIDDAEAFVVRIVSRYATDLNQQDHEELVTYLVEVAWELSLRYESGRSPNGFKAGAGTILARRITDWKRSKFGRTRYQFAHGTYERARPQLVSLDVERDRLDETLAAGTGDPADDRDPDLFGGMAEERDRQEARDLELLGLGPPRPAA